MTPRESPDPQAIAKALAHPTRVMILMKMNTPKRTLSPSKFRDETGELLGTVSYHFKVLDELGLIELIEKKPVRGATEHIYAPVKRAMAWTKMYASLTPAVKQNFAATALVGAVQSVGTAIDAGTFDARPDSHLSFDTLRVDMPGWERIMKTMAGALLTLLQVEGEVTARIAENPDAETWIASYLMSGWEAAPPGLAPPSEPESKLPRLDQLGCFPRAELLRLLDAALEGLRAQPPDEFAGDYMEMRGEVERLLSEATGEAAEGDD
jgi:DNA-binding transcriptional ArsR family regulator